MLSTQTQIWTNQTIIRKATYDISNSTTGDTIRPEDYIKQNAFLLTVQLRTNGSSQHVRHAQERLHKEFGRYHASTIRTQCFNDGKVTRRNKKFQPLAFLAFDIEGSRHNGFSTNTANPHGHGIILFHENTSANFRYANERFLTLDAGYMITNPTSSISLIDLKPINSLGDLSRYLGYALKLENKLRNCDTNHAPYNFYPASSMDFPFWHSLDAPSDTYSKSRM